MSRFEGKMVTHITYTIPDDNAYNPLAHINELADGEYKTGRVASGYVSDGGLKDFPHEEIVIIKNHKPIGFRLPDGKAYILPSPDETPFNPPTINFPPPAE